IRGHALDRAAEPLLLQRGDVADILAVADIAHRLVHCRETLAPMREPIIDGRLPEIEHRELRVAPAIDLSRRGVEQCARIEQRRGSGRLCRHVSLPILLILASNYVASIGSASVAPDQTRSNA